MSVTVQHRARQIVAAVDLALTVCGQSFDREARKRALNLLAGGEADEWLFDYLDALPEAGCPLDAVPVPLIHVHPTNLN